MIVAFYFESPVLSYIAFHLGALQPPVHFVSSRHPLHIPPSTLFVLKRASELVTGIMKLYGLEEKNLSPARLTPSSYHHERLPLQPKSANKRPMPKDWEDSQKPQKSARHLDDLDNLSQLVEQVEKTMKCGHLQTRDPLPQKDNPQLSSHLELPQAAALTEDERYLLSQYESGQRFPARASEMCEHLLGIIDHMSVMLKEAEDDKRFLQATVEETNVLLAKSETRAKELELQMRSESPRIPKTHSETTKRASEVESPSRNDRSGDYLSRYLTSPQSNSPRPTQCQTRMPQSRNSSKSISRSTATIDQHPREQDAVKRSSKTSKATGSRPTYVRKPSRQRIRSLRRRYSRRLGAPIKIERPRQHHARQVEELKTGIARFHVSQAQLSQHSNGLAGVL